MRARLTALVFLAFLVAAVAAVAAVVGGELTDPTGDSTAGPGTDMVRGAWSFDPDAGHLEVSVTFVAKPTDADYGIVNATVRDASAAGCGGPSFAILRGSGRTGSASASVGTAADGEQPDGSTGASVAPATNIKSDDGRTTTMEVTHQRLVGRSAACVVFTISNHGVKDSGSVPALGAPVTPGATPTPQPGGGYNLPPGGNPGPATPIKVRLASRKLKFSKGAARLTIIPSTGGLTGKLSLLVGKKQIAQGRYSARTPIAIRTKLFLTRAGAAYFRKHRAGRATLVVKSNSGARTVTERFRVTTHR